MPKFSEGSLIKLATCHIELRVLFNEVVKEFDCTVLEGYRDEAAQEAAVKAGNSKLHYPHGKHNADPSLAVDVAPYPLDWKDSQRFCYFSGFVVATALRLRADGKMTYRVRWGGDWNGNYLLSDEKGLRDLVHFELIVA